MSNSWIKKKKIAKDAELAASQPQLSKEKGSTTKINEIKALNPAEILLIFRYTNSIKPEIKWMIKGIKCAV